MSSDTADWRPAFLTPAQGAALALFADLVVPRTQAAGALEALVPQRIDIKLAAESKRMSDAFVAALETVDDESREQCGVGFAELSTDSRVELLRRISASGHRSFGAFQTLKMWITGAYYSSEAGWRSLGWSQTPRTSQSGLGTL